MRSLSICFIFTLLTISSSAQSADERVVSSAVEQLRKAMIDADSIALDKLTCDSLSYGHSSGLVQNKKEFIAALTSGRSDFVTLDLTEQTISISGSNAIVRHILSATTNDSGKPGIVKLKILLVWTKEKGKWRLLARQAVKFP